MKNMVHLFSRDVVSEFLDTRDSPNFEFIAALLMQRLYEEQWRAATMIGFYLTNEYADLLSATDSPDRTLLMDALENGIQEDNQIDFVIACDDGIQEFQLKRFGMKGQQGDTEGLIRYLNELKAHYAPTDAACLVALAEFASIDLPSVKSGVEQETFPFTELLLIGIESDKFLIAGMFPNEGWSVYDLNSVVRLRGSRQIR
jgi:hypothetical protein